MKIVILDRKTLGYDLDLSAIEQFGDVTTYETTHTTQTLSRVKDCDIVITNKVIIDKEIMQHSSFKLVCITATGTNNVDLEYAQTKNIEVKNVAGYSPASVAQLTMTLALELIQKISYYKNYVDSKQWEKSEIFTHIDKPFFELENKNWGIIGLGDIGKKVAQIAQGFNCNVNYYSTSGMNNNTDYTSISLDKLLKTSDIISIHCPLNDTTFNMINKTNLKDLKEGTILLNLSRGGIINEKDLSEAIDQKDLYCGLDVVEVEPIKKDNPLNFVKNKERLIITPHIGWASIEARTRLLNGVIKNIQKFVFKYK